MESNTNTANYVTSHEMQRMIDEKVERANSATIRFRRFREGAIVPTRGTDLSAGWDIYAYVNEEFADISIHGHIALMRRTVQIDNYDPNKVRTIMPGEMVPIKTGINVRIPEGFEIQVRPRSGLAFKSCITVLNTPGTIDCDYDGDGEKFEINVMLINHGLQPFIVNHGMRIAQLVVSKLVNVTITEDFEDNTMRLESNRSGGFGHTGIK